MADLDTWGCKIGEIDRAKLPPGCDGPMRDAVRKAYRELTGEDPKFIFSGWGCELSEFERAAHEDRLPDPNASMRGASSLMPRHDPAGEGMGC